MTIQPIPSFNHWALIERDSTQESIETYTTSTGHIVILRVVHHEMCSHVRVWVTDRTAFVDACNVHFDGVNHEAVASSFARYYLHDIDLECVCRCFDEMCIKFSATDDDLSDELE